MIENQPQPAVAPGRGRVIVMQTGRAAALIATAAFILWEATRPSPPPPPPAAPAAGQAPALVPVRRDDMSVQWRAEIDKILAAGGSTMADRGSMMEQLCNYIGALPPAAQPGAMQYLLIRLPDDRYSPLIPICIRARFPEPVMQIVITDVMSRPDAVRLPCLILFASSDDPASREQAFDSLRTLLGQDAGSDVAQWESLVHKYLRAEGHHPN